MQLGEWVWRQRIIGLMRERLALRVAQEREAEQLADGKTLVDQARAHGDPGTQFDPEACTGLWFDPELGEWTAWAWWGPADRPERLVVRASDLRRNAELEEALRNVEPWSRDGVPSATMRNAELPGQEDR